ncbi:MAG: pyridoxamine 5'-phosphate oxidase [Opitutaceae bacterium]|nr:pyridoxamine 5'-phosphate oxidase [Verrucomicrobiales bacterium]
MNLADIRIEYTRDRVRRETLAPDPIAQFQLWLEQAVHAECVEPTAMSLATATPEGNSLLRTVLLKGIDQRGFIFFTNLESRKARHIADNSHVSLLFPWLALERQVIIVGTAVPLTTMEALDYFASRPRESQLAAWASPQSALITSRKILETAWEHMKMKFSEGRIPLPPFWGGYLVVPQTIEFWQGGAHRLHDRFEYTRQPDGSWTIGRLAP